MDLEALSVMANFYNAGKCYRYYYRKKVITHTQLYALRNTIMNDLAKKRHCYYSGTINMRGTNYYLFGFKLCSTILNLYLAPLLEQDLIARFVIGYKGKAITITILNFHKFDLSPNDPHISTSLIAHERSFLLK